MIENSRAKLTIMHDYYSSHFSKYSTKPFSALILVIQFISARNSKKVFGVFDTHVGWNLANI